MIKPDLNRKIEQSYRQCESDAEVVVQILPQLPKVQHLNIETMVLMNYYAVKELSNLIDKISSLLEEVPKPSREFCDLPEAAEYLGIGKSTLRKALADGEIICDRVGRKLRFSKAQLDKYIRRGKSDAEIDAEVENTILSNKRKRK